MAETGDRIGAYEIVRLIARGGMATVYEAHQPALDRRVALKQLDLRVQDPAMLDRFIRESRIAASFDHPNIVTVYDFFESDSVPYIAMEYLPRGSLRDCVGRLEPAQVFGVLECMLAALAHAEQRGVAHRDLKPENVLITRDGAVKIADFGIAKAYTETTSKFTATGVAVGTPTYMAPEQALAQPVGPYTDLYALGVMAYEMLSGEPPFAGGDSPMSLMYKHVSEPPPRLEGVDARLADWVGRLLEKAPEARPPGAAAAWSELEEVVVDTLGPYWRRHAALPGSAATDPEPVTPRIEPPRTRVQRRRSLVPLIAGAAAIAVVAGIAAAVLSDGGEGSGGASVPHAAAAWELDGAKASLVAGAPKARTIVIAGGGAPISGDAAGFGAALASGDFDGDGKADLAIGGSRALTVQYGPDRKRTAHFDARSLALAAGDLNGDGYADLAVGGGGLELLFGGPEGLTKDKARTLQAPGRGDRQRFGNVLAIGEATGDGRLDVAEAGPGHSSLCAGGPNGPTACTVLGDGAAALAIGDVNGDGAGDVVQGVPDGGAPVPKNDDGTGPVAPAGVLRIWAGGDGGPAARPTTLSQATKGVRGDNQGQDEFGAAVVVADLDGDDAAEVIVGAPGESRPNEDDHTGRVTLVRGGAEGHGTKDDEGFGERTKGLPFKLPRGARLGSALTLLDADGDGTLDLIAAAPGAAKLMTLPGVDGGFTTRHSSVLDVPAEGGPVTLGAP